ncbi:hypothetical protein [Aeromonas hydrophila]|uniref:hypothetical protein n=1 Tax=Aeromonas hydrophila TaxID=644 RepID=UPI00111A2D51|nr:hypothetical protein [Aeromonas hydrophila]
MSKFTVGNEVVEHENPNKVFTVKWVDGKWVYCTRTTNGTNFESKCCPEQFLDLAKSEKKLSVSPEDEYSINPAGAS